MSREFKKNRRPITRDISRERPHSHEAGEPEMSLEELRQHLVYYHGWSIGQLMMSRCQGPEGEGYMRQWHKNDHVPLRTAE